MNFGPEMHWGGFAHYFGDVQWEQDVTPNDQRRSQTRQVVMDADLETF